MDITDLATDLDLAPGELIRQADRHTCAVQAWLSSRAPGAVCLDGIGVQACSTGLPLPLLNLALSRSYPPGTSDSVIIGEIERVKAFFAARDVPWYWWLGPNLYPCTLGEQLQTCGMVADRPRLPAMVAPLPAQPVDTSPHIRVWLAATHADLQAASTIRRVAFGFPEGTALDYFEAMHRDWMRGSPARLYVASVADGPPAAIGALIMGNGLPGIYVMATLPESQRQGLGKAILTRILSDAAKEGHRFIVLTASRFGYPLYRQFGFEHVFDYIIYSYVK